MLPEEQGGGAGDHGDGRQTAGDHGSGAAGGHGGGGTGGHGAMAGGHGAMAGGHSYTAWTINGKSYPSVPDLVVREGELVRLRFLNISDEFHPMHLHGHDLRVIAWDGHPVDRPQLYNTVNVAPGQTVDVDFIADNPGRWLLHCHILHHATGGGGKPGGLMAVVAYEGAPGRVAH